jgi:hypothetical protein
MFASIRVTASALALVRAAHAVHAQDFLDLRLGRRAEQQVDEGQRKVDAGRAAAAREACAVDLVQVWAQQGLVGAHVDVRIQRPGQGCPHAVQRARLRQPQHAGADPAPAGRRAAARDEGAQVGGAQASLGFVRDEQHEVPVALVGRELVGTAHVHVQALRPQHLGRQAQRLHEAGPRERIRLARMHEQHAQRRLPREAGQFSVLHQD